MTITTDAIDGLAGEDRLAYQLNEYAARVGLSRRLLEEEIKAKRLKARRAGRRILILRDDALAYLNSLPAA